MVGHELGDVLWYGFVAGVLAVGRHFMSDAIYQYVVFLCGGLVLALGVVFIGLGFRIVSMSRSAGADKSA